MSIAGVQGSTRGQAVVPSSQGTAPTGPKIRGRKEEHEFIHQARAQAGPVHHRSAFHQQAGDLLFAEHGKDAIEIGTPLVRVAGNVRQ